MERTGNITFSVIVPVYNVQAYLSACVKSVVEQAGPADWECILVDDGSTDACPAMCDAFAQLCPGVTVIHRSNGGLAAARNTGIKAAKGKWLLFLDSDDAMDHAFTAEELDSIVRGNGCTVLYIQTLDDIFVQSYADLFIDKLAAAQSGETLLYRVTDAGFAPMPMEVSAQ